MTERVALLERSVKAAEDSQRLAGIDLVDEAGNLLEHIDLSRDPEPLRKALRGAQEQLANYREGLELDKQLNTLV